MQKIRKILTVVSEKIVLPTNPKFLEPFLRKLRYQAIINNNTDLIGPRWRRSKKFY